VEGNYATGNQSDAADEANRFINLFPTNHMHYGYMDLQNWSNALNLSAGVGFAPLVHLIVGLDYWLLARATDEDGWVNAGGKPLLTPDQTAGDGHHEDRLLGHEVDLTVKTPVNEHLKVVSGFSLFAPAGYAKAKGEDVQIWAFTMLVLDL